ncbi:MAG: DUF1080 domain-containing protein, partial [Sphingobacteriaceae bacterium]
MKTIKIFLTSILTAIILTGTASAQIKKGYVSLFDGKTLKGWKRLAGLADYKVVDGTIQGTTVINSGNTFLVTEKEYGDFVLELDAKLESNVSNSGIQTRSHYDPAGYGGKGKVYGRQCEIDPSPRDWTGGIYDESRRDWIYPLDLNAKAKGIFKIGEFNHIKIECIGNETKTWINGVAAGYVVDTLDATGFIGLQVHGITAESQANKKVWFKNIQIKTTNLKPEPFPKGIYVANFVSNSLNTYEKQDGWKLLFDGKTTNGWKKAKQGNVIPVTGWEVSNGMLSNGIVKEGEHQSGGDIITLDEYKAFDVSFQFKIPEGANSGVKYFVTMTEKNKNEPLGLEYQILDDAKHPDAKNGRDGNRTQSSLYDLITTKK